MYTPLSLRKNFLWTFTGNTVKAASTWGIIAMLVKMGGTVMVGKFELGRAIAVPLMAITMLQLRAIQVTDARGEYSFADYLGTRLFMTILGVVAFVIIAWRWYSGETAWVILLWGLAVSIESVSDIVRGLFQRYERMNLSGTSMVIKGLASIVTAGALIWLTGRLTEAIAGIVVIYLLVLFLYDFPKAYHLLAYKSAAENIPRQIMPRFNVKITLALLWLALPLGIVYFSGSLQSSIPKLILESYHGEVALGYFGPIVYPVMLGALIVSAMGQSAAPRLANYYINNLTAYCHLMRKLFLLALGMGLLFVGSVAVFGKFVLRVLYTADYANYHTEFIILGVGAAMAFISFFFGYGLTSARVFRRQLLIAIVTCLVAIIMAYLLIPLYGLRGTAITFTATSFTKLTCCFITLLWIIRKRRREINIRAIEQ